MFRTIAIGTLILGFMAPAMADVYRWVDEHGSVHYSDEWVPGSQLIKSTRPRPPGAEQDAPPRAPAEQHQLAQASGRASTQLAQGNAAKAVHQDVAKAREQQCKEAKDRYTKAIQARRIYNTGADGQREYMPDADADAYRLKARNDVQDACGSVPATP